MHALPSPTLSRPHLPPPPSDDAPPDRAPPPPYWLQPGVDAASVLVMFESLYLFSTTFAWYWLEACDVVRARFVERGDTLHLRLETTYEGPGRLRLALHVAHRAETIDAWRERLLGDTQISIVGLRRRELPATALTEWRELGRHAYDLFPAVQVGIARRPPRADEWELALRALEAFDLLFDPLALGFEGEQRRVLASGERVELAILKGHVGASDAVDADIDTRGTRH